MFVSSTTNNGCNVTMWFFFFKKKSDGEEACQCSVLMIVAIINVIRWSVFDQASPMSSFTSTWRTLRGVGLETSNKIIIGNGRRRTAARARRDMATLDRRDGCPKVGKGVAQRKV